MSLCHITVTQLGFSWTATCDEHEWTATHDSHDKAKRAGAAHRRGKAKRRATGERRDGQRTRVYKAGWAVDEDRQTIPNHELQAWVNRALDCRPIRSRWGVRRVDVELGKGGGRHFPGVIVLGVWARNPVVILHELAHEFTPRHYASHGPEFAGVYLFLVRSVMGKEKADELKAAFKRHKVKTNRKAIPAVRQDVPPARATRERERKAAAKQAALKEIASWLRDGTITRSDLRAVKP